MAESVNLAMEMRKRVTHIFSSLKNRSLEHKRKLTTQVYCISYIKGYDEKTKCYSIDPWCISYSLLAATFLRGPWLRLTASTLAVP